MSLISKVNRLIHDKLENLSDAALFLSDIYKSYLESFLAVFARDHNRHVELHVVDQPDLTAETDGTNLIVSGTSKMLGHYQSRAIKSNTIKGLCTHEMAHILFTDFPVYNAATISMAQGSWYPAAPYTAGDTSIEATYCSEMEDMMSKQHPAVGRALSKLWFRILNSVEDAYIETRMVDRYPGLTRYIATVNVIQYDTAMSIDVEEEKAEKCKDPVEKAQRKLTAMFSGILHYARFGELKMADNYYSPLVESLYSCIPFIDSSILMPDTYNRISNVNRIFVACWPYMKDILEEVEKNPPSANSDMEEALASALAQVLGELAKQGGGTNNAPRNRNSKPIDSKVSDAESARKGATGNASASLSSAGQQSCGADSGDSSTSGGSGASNSGDGDKQDGKKSHPTMPSGSDDGMADKIAKEIARALAEEEIETQQLKDLQKEISGFRGGRGVSLQRAIQVTPDMRRRYRMVAEGKNGGENLLEISKKLQRQMMAVLKTQIDGGKMTRLPIGNKISTKDLIRDDPFFFTKTRAPQDKADLAVCILVDESGSMGGKNIDAAIKTAIILEDFLRNMHIPCCIYGHTTGGLGCVLYSYQEFDRAGENDRYRLMEMGARSGTPTAAALNTCYQLIKKRDESCKLIIVITDGEPGDNGNNRIQQMVRESHRHGIEIFGVGIAGAGPSLERIYGGRTIAIDDLNELPKRMVRLVKRYIRFV